MAQDQKIEDINDSERTWIEENVATAFTFLDEFLGPQTEMNLSNLEKLWDACATSSNTKDPNAIINAVGLAFGKIIETSLGWRWVVVTDAYGTEIGLHKDNSADALMFPTNMVAKRWPDKKQLPLTSLYNDMARIP